MADGRHCQKPLNRHISATFWPILMKFGMVMQISPLQVTDHLNFEFFKNQHGCGRHLEKPQKWRYHSSGLTDLSEIWHDYAKWVS